MLKNIAQQTFESYQKVRQLVLDTECKYLTSADEVDEKLGFITDSVVYRIMYCLGVTDENSDDGFGVILECIQDGDSFEYMLKRLELNENCVNYFADEKFEQGKFNGTTINITCCGMDAEEAKESIDKVLDSLKNNIDVKTLSKTLEKDITTEMKRRGVRI